ncbi:MAG: hypothetical protein ACTSPE_00585 [Candidatus Thorarchaeota archaeon]
MEKVDFRRDLKHLYSAPRHPVIVEVPDLQYPMIDGHGPPEGDAY